MGVTDMTLETLKKEPHVTGLKQVSKAVSKGDAQCVFLAVDADERVRLPLQVLCDEKRVPVVNTATMADLGRACSIEVGAAAAAILKG
ncbi:MAG: L7Ae/L30e/S12e/Gadd45 family ribosomal protein [Negativicutes bacterium]